MPKSPNIPPIIRGVLGWLTDILNIGRGWGWWNKKPGVNAPRDIRKPR